MPRAYQNLTASMLCSSIENTMDYYSSPKKNMAGRKDSSAEMLCIFSDTVERNKIKKITFTQNFLHREKNSLPLRGIFTLLSCYNYYNSLNYETLLLCHSELDSESRLYIKHWIPAFAGMTNMGFRNSRYNHKL